MGDGGLRQKCVRICFCPCPLEPGIVRTHAYPLSSITPFMLVYSTRYGLLHVNNIIIIPSTITTGILASPGAGWPPDHAGQPFRLKIFLEFARDRFETPYIIQRKSQKTGCPSPILPGQITHLTFFSLFLQKLTPLTFTIPPFSSSQCPS